MSTHPVKRRSRPFRVVEGEVVDVPAPVTKRSAGFSFRYSYAEFSAIGGSAQLKAKRASYEDGKLTTESFEGEIDQETYVRAQTDAQRLFADQAALYLGAFSSFLLPFKRD